jgi:hypothetical protein
MYVLEMEALKELCEQARNGLREIAVREFRARDLIGCAAYSVQLRKPMQAYRGIARYSRYSRDKVSNDNSISVQLYNSVTDPPGLDVQYCTTRDGTEIIRCDKNKIIYRGLVPPVSAVPANYTIQGRKFFGCCVTYNTCT